MNENQMEKSVNELKQSLQGKVLQRADEGYDEAKAIWNGAVTVLPALIIIPETAKDVQAAVLYAGKNNLPLSVLGGGHDWAGRALNQDGVLISLRKLKTIQIDGDAKIAQVGGGVISRELIAAADPYDLVAVTGTMDVVGFAGLTLGGGYGPLSPSYGLALDNLLGVEIVLHDGSLVNANANENADLFWALRGGGGNFGVVTSMQVKLHPAKSIVAGMMFFPFDQANKVLRSYNKFIQSAPDELSIQAGIVSGPDQIPLLYLLPTWYGETNEGKKQIAAIEKFGTPVMTQIAPMRYKEVIALFDEHVGTGFPCEIQTRWLSDLNDHALEKIITAGAEKTSSMSAIIISHFRGAAARVNLTDTAFGLRKPHFMLEFVAVWEKQDSTNGQIHQQWVRDLSASLITDALAGGYPNILGPDEHQQISKAYGENLERLQQIKSKYDPSNMFKAISIPFSK